MQIILQATHGVVSGAPAFFKRAFGDSPNDFDDILLRPHHFIFNRDWYERLEGQSECDEFKAHFSRLSATERRELLELLSCVEPRDIVNLPKRTASSKLRQILTFYKPLSKQEEARIWSLQRQSTFAIVPDDERVEDAGLEEESDQESVAEGVPA